MAELAFYEYVAQAGNSIRRARMQAQDERMVRSILREQGMVPIEIKKVKPKADDGGDPGNPNALPTREKKKEFFYVAIPTDGGENVRGMMFASNEREARQLLRERGLIPSTVEIKRLWHEMMMAGKVTTVTEMRQQARDQAKPKTLSHRLSRFFNQRIALKDMLFYSSQLSTMNEAGLSFSQSMEILSGLITNYRLRVIHEVVRQQVMEGVSLSEAYGNFEDELPRIFIELISVGEASGNLEQTLQRLVVYLDNQLELTGKVRSALSYPLILMGLISLIVAGLMVFVVPTFINLFKSFKVTLPPTTQFLLNMSWFFTHMWYLVPLVPLSIFGVWRLIMSTKFGRQFYDMWEYRIPIFGKLIYKMTISRILHNLALFLNCGITVLSALDLSRQSITNAYTSLRLEEIRIGISQGMRLSTLFEASGIFPPMVNYLLVAGEEAGAIDELLERGAKYVDKEVEATIKAMSAALEPILTVMVAGVVLFIIGSLYLPLIGLMNGGKHGGGM